MSRAAAPASVFAVSHLTAQALSPPSLLVVEDESIIALDLKLQLEQLGYTVIGTAESGEQALGLVREHAPALVLMDIRLKGPMDGIEAAGRIADAHRVPVVYLTSHSDDDTVRNAAATAPYGFLTKPFRIRELRAAIEVALTKARMERQLREADRWFASTLRCVHDGVIVTGLDGRIGFMNPAAEALLGVPLEGALGRPVADVVRYAPPPAGATPMPVENAATRALREGRVVGVLHARPLLAADRGVPVDESAAPIDDEIGRCMGVVLILRDATERMAQEVQLRASEARFRSAFDHAPLGMALVALDGRFMQVNDALCRLLGCDAQWLRGRDSCAVTVPEDIHHEMQRLHELAATGTPVTQFEKRFVRRDRGEVVWTLASVSLLREADAPVCYLYQVHDLTEQKQAAEQLAQVAAQRIQVEAVEVANRARSEFFSRASHEMRTPLNAVLGFAQLMQLRGFLDEAETHAYAEQILKAGKHMLAMVEDVLDLQRVADGRLQMQVTSVALLACVNDAVELLQPTAKQLGVELTIDIAANLAVHADETRLRQVLLNVGSNAIKYNRRGGKVAWSAHASSGGRVRLIVADTGSGMTADQLQRLYHPFERLGREKSDVPGTGLGLTIVHSLVEKMGGTIDISSAPGESTRVEIELAAA